jgi:hypothetical protein
MLPASSRMRPEDSMEAPSGQSDSGTGSARTPAVEPRSAAQALATVASWREQENARHQRELQEVDEELARLAAAIEDLQRQLTALGDFRTELVTREQELEAEEHRRAHEGLFEALGKQAEDVSIRARLAARADQSRNEAIEEALNDSEVADAWKEYQEYNTNKEAIAALPASYRTAIALHHESTAARLAEAVRTADPGPTKLDEPGLALDVLFTIVPGGEEESGLASVVVPVREVVWSDWHDRPNDLQLQVAARVAQALYEAAHALGHITAHSMQGGHRGMLAIELDLASISVDEAREKIEQHLASVTTDSSELVAAGITLNPTHVPVTFLLPPEEEAADDV